MSRKSFFAALAAVAVGLAGLTGCQQQKAEVALEVKNFVASDSNAYAVTELEVSWPVAGSQVLVDSIRAMINDFLGGTYTGSMDDGQAFVDYYQKQADSGLADEHEAMVADYVTDADDPEDYGLFSIPGEDHTAFTLAWQNENFVTYDITFFDYHSGAAHGVEGSFGVTFLKADGTRMNWNDITDTQDDDFQTVFRHGLMSYFSSETENDLAGELFLDDDHTVYNLPMPGREPCLRAEGVEFYYGEYEISYYAAGTPSFIVPWAKIRPFLSERIQKLLPADAAGKDGEGDGYVHRTEFL